MTNKPTCTECKDIGYLDVARHFKCRRCNADHSPTKPDHYHKGGIDVFTYASANFTVEEVNAYHRITALKYITRAGKKDGNPYEQDIKKAIVHLEECLKGVEG